MSDLFSLAGKTALVTGSAAGLGFEIAAAMAVAGAHVLLNGRDAGRLAEAITAIHHRGGKAEALVLDVFDPAAVDAAIGPDLKLDILVNNAGARDRRGFLDMEDADFRRLVDLDLLAPAALTRRVARGMVARKAGGRIINMTSIAGPLSRAGDAAYTTAKGGLEALTRALAADLGPHGITVNAIAPGYFLTAPNEAQARDQVVADWLSRRTSLGRWGRPEEVAGAAVFLASAAGAYVTGHVLAVDGGYMAHF